MRDTAEVAPADLLIHVEGDGFVLGLFEGVCTGAADGYARMADKPALTMLHLGPGLANGLANLHNARRARSPVVNIVGEHASWHIANDPPLHSDIVGLARAVSGWVRTSATVAGLPQDMADAIAAARQGQIATLIVPNDLQLAELDAFTRLPSPASQRPLSLDETAVAAAVETLRRYTKVAIILGRRALRPDGLHAARRVQAATGCDLLCESFPSRLEWGAGLPNPTRIPYFPEQSLPLTATTQQGSVKTTAVTDKQVLRATRGRITVESPKGALDAKCVSGDVIALAIDGVLGDYALNAEQGDINLLVPDTADATLFATATNGQVNSKVRLSGSVQGDKREFSGPIGAGKFRVDLGVVGGVINID